MLSSRPQGFPCTQKHGEILDRTPPFPKRLTQKPDIPIGLQIAKIAKTKTYSVVFIFKRKEFYTLLHRKRSRKSKNPAISCMRGWNAGRVLIISGFSTPQAFQPNTILPTRFPSSARSNATTLQLSTKMKRAARGMRSDTGEHQPSTQRNVGPTKK